MTDKDKAVAHYTALAAKAAELPQPLPLLIVQTGNGFAVMNYHGDIPQVSMRDLLCFGSLDDSYSYRNDGAMAAIRKHFEPKAES